MAMAGTGGGGVHGSQCAWEVVCLSAREVVCLGGSVHAVGVVLSHTRTRLQDAVCVRCLQPHALVQGWRVAPARVAARSHDESG